eukprot:2387347-Pleurochrysis_carterae.AAC.2
MPISAHRQQLDPGLLRRQADFLSFLGGCLRWEPTQRFSPEVRAKMIFTPANTWAHVPAEARPQAHYYA